ncbi:hypothetical protein KI387_038759 [Taxus chinensis]|uniref:Uncharacterized protein n=1 Tax=Taxus chinensis TaxID=29808 RepID=A0AA38C9Q4_TAXCH|nr:hypothetical protein KI387_038759 [Taxus chinensis]
MALDKFPDVYGRICHLQKYAGSTESINLPMIDGKRLSLDALIIANGEVLLGLWWANECLAKLGAYSFGDCSEEAMQQNLFPLFFKLSIYAFLRVTFTEFGEFHRWDMGLGTIESETYKQAFNSVFAAASYSLLHAKINQPSTDVVLQLQKLAEQTAKETLAIIGPHATDCLLKSLAAEFTKIRLLDGQPEWISPFEVSYSSRLDELWTVNAYCPRLSMELWVPSNERKDADLEYALSHQLLHCEIQFRHQNRVNTDRIDVEFSIRNLRCQSFQLNSINPIRSNLEDEWYFPAKITLTVSPEYRSRMHAVSLASSSPNPEVIVTIERSYEATFKAEKTPAEFKVGRKKSHALRLTNWVFDHSAVNNTEGRFEWTLYDNSNGIPVFSHKPPQFKTWNPNTWSRGKAYKAFRAIAQGGREGSVRPFTSKGGVVFSRDLYGKPITWKFKRDLMEGRRTMKWNVEGEIWMAYYPNKYATNTTNRYMETRYHKFCQQVELPFGSQ